MAGSRFAPLRLIKDFVGLDLPRKLAQLEQNLREKFESDNARAFGPFAPTEIKVTHTHALPWQLVEVNPTATLRVLLPSPRDPKVGWIAVKNTGSSTSEIQLVPFDGKIDGQDSLSVSGAYSSWLLCPDPARNTWLVITGLSVTLAVTALTPGNDGDVLKTVGGAVAWVPFPNGVIALTGASNTFDLTHLDNFLTISHGSATQATVPANATTAFPIGSVLQGAQYGAGQLEIVAAGGVTIRTAETLFMRKQYSPFALVKIGTNEWILFGDLRLA